MGSKRERASHSSGGRRARNQAGPYELLSVLGQGASGTVYLARRPGIERMFALKLLAADLDPEGRARVQREAQIASRLDHAGIVRVVDFGVLGPQLYIVMEHIEGQPLRNVIETRATREEMHLDVCNACHPFFTGEQRIVDTAGRVERFNRRFKRPTD